jgi:hypothetical protein
MFFFDDDRPNHPNKSLLVGLEFPSSVLFCRAVTRAPIYPSQGAQGIDRSSSNLGLRVEASSTALCCCNCARLCRNWTVVLSGGREDRDTYL